MRPILLPPQFPTLTQVHTQYGVAAHVWQAGRRPAASSSGEGRGGVCWLVEREAVGGEGERKRVRRNEEGEEGTMVT